MPFFFESESNFCMNMSLTALFNGNSKVAPFFLKTNSSEQVWQTLRVPWTASLKFPFDGSLRSRQLLRLQTQAMVFPKEPNLLLLHLVQVLIEQLNGSWWSLLQEPRRGQANPTTTSTLTPSQPPPSPQTFFQLDLFFAEDLLPVRDGAGLMSPPQLSCPLSPHHVPCSSLCMIPKVARGPPRPKQCRACPWWPEEGSAGAYWASTKGPPPPSTTPR